MSDVPIGQDAEDARSRPPGYFDLRRALADPGCPVCSGASRSAWRYMDGVLWEGVTDPGIRTQLRVSRGFCREHAMLLLKVAAKEHGQAGVAVIYEDLLGQIERDLRTAWSARRRWRRHRPRELARPPAACPACRSASQRADTYLILLGEAEAGSDLGATARSGEARLCLPHLLRGIQTARSDAAALRLQDIFLTGTRGLQRDLREFIRKHDYRFAHEPMSTAEGSAWARVVQVVVGAPLRAPRER
jgi:hypothetical protein